LFFFFSSGEISPFIEKEIGKILEKKKESTNSTNLANYFCKIRQKFDMKKMN
jgi:hypothetical protein